MAYVKSEPLAESAARGAAESLGWQLRAALPPLRLRSVSIFDPAGEMLWLSEGTIGEEERRVAGEVLREIEARPSDVHLEKDLPDACAGVFLAIRSQEGALAGLAMILLDRTVPSAGSLSARILTSTMRDLLGRLAEALPRRELDPVGEITIEILPPESVDEVLTIELAQAPALGEAPQARPVPVPVPPRAPLGELQIEELGKLRQGGRLRRFHVLPGAGSDGGGELISQIEALLAWLCAQARREHPLRFSLPVSRTMLEAHDLPERIHESLQAAGAAAAAIGFEIEEASYAHLGPRIERLVRTLEPLGSFIVVDDFTFEPSALELLRSKCVQILNVHPRLIEAALRDKLAQARIVAIGQAARVLGIHCAAKQVESQAARRWLTAAGFDFALGLCFDPPRPLESLAAELVRS